jgi:hypothetical protein
MEHSNDSKTKTLLNMYTGRKASEVGLKLLGNFGNSLPTLSEHFWSHRSRSTLWRIFIQSYRQRSKIFLLLGKKYFGRTFTSTIRIEKLNLLFS